MIVESSEDVISLSGALKQPFWDSVQTAISLTLNRHPSGVIVDCGQITEITEEGAHTFELANDFVLSHDNARIIFANIPQHVQDVLKATPSVKSQLATAPTIAEARKSLDLLDAAYEDKKRKFKETVRSRHILAVICPNECHDHFLHQLDQLVSTAPAHIVFLLPVIVPRELPLHAPVPDEEARMSAYGDKVRTTFEDGQNLTELRLERTRDIPSLVAEIAEEINAEQVVVAIPADKFANSDSNKTFGALLEKVQRPLMFVRSSCGG